MVNKLVVPWTLVVLLLATVVLLLFMQSCRYIRLIDDEEELAAISVPEKNRDVRLWLQKMDAAEGPGLMLQERPLRVLRMGPEGAEVATADPGLAEVLLSFIQISDVQLRDERVKLWGPWVSRLLDSLVETNEYGVDQERFDSSVYLALVKAINREFAPLGADDPGAGGHPPLFVVHTGDAIHAGVMQELWEFLWITDRLRLPWLQIIGNHDHTTFGTALGDVTVHNPRIGYLPVGGWKNFVKFHGHSGMATSRAIFDPGIAIAPPGQQLHPPTEEAFGSDDHGFDLKSFGEEGRESGEPVELGCYAITRDLTNPEVWDERVKAGCRVRFLFLNTAANLDLDEGQVGERRLAWVQRQLEHARIEEEFVLAFAHHGFGRGLDEDHERTSKLRQLFLESERFVGYFTGHTHRQYVDLIRSEDGQRAFWQVVAPSVLEYPQAGLTIGLLRLVGGRLALDVRRFWNGYPELPEGADPDPFAGTVEQQLEVQAQRARRDARRELRKRGRDPDEVDAEPPYRLLLDLHWNG